ncbi:MAG: hypothetical protein GWN71_10495, partial [Gammaproteobacteria bacterium]|nr:hypothetical protein [Gammaproteobacteria bacterium]NIX41988.1 hypothetical protein [Gemmatimonadota bacterium]
MTVADAQREVRTVFVGGAVGQGVSAVVWLVSAVAGSQVSTAGGILVLVVGGAFIFPLTVAVLRLAGRPAALDPANPLSSLARQVAFVVPLLLPLAGAAAIHRIEWFYPAMMLIVGAHYLPFVFLYGMPAFYALGGGLLAMGMLLGLEVGPLAGAPWTTGGWVTGAALLAFAVWAGMAYG